MKEALALIEKIIEEHKQIIRGIRTLEQVANDVDAILGLEGAKEAFMPGRFKQGEDLQKLRQTLEIIDEGLRAHFNREETGLLTAFEKYGDKKIVSALNALLAEHKDLRHRFDHAKKHVTELTGGGLSGHLWAASAHDMRAHMSHTGKLLVAHNQTEQKLLRTLQKRLQRKIKENE